jgi:hypothetical protein
VEQFFVSADLRAGSGFARTAGTAHLRAPHRRASRRKSYYCEDSSICTRYPLSGVHEPQTKERLKPLRQPHSGHSRLPGTIVCHSTTERLDILVSQITSLRRPWSEELLNGFAKRSLMGQLTCMKPTGEVWNEMHSFVDTHILLEPSSVRSRGGIDCGVVHVDIVGRPVSVC